MREREKELSDSCFHQAVVTGLSLWEVVIGYTRSLAPEDFTSAVFTSAHFQKIAQICANFQKIAQISILCNFHYIREGIPSLMRFWLPNDLSGEF